MGERPAKPHGLAHLLGLGPQASADR